MKILTYNIHKGFTTAGLKFVLSEMKNALQANGADIVFLQEIHGSHEVYRGKVRNLPMTSQFEFLADSIWPHYAYGKNAIYRGGDHGNAILSKHPFASWENISLARHASRSILRGVLKSPDLPVPVHVICIHFGLFEFERKQQLRELSRQIQQVLPRDSPLIIAGDFNDWKLSAKDILEKELGLEEVFRKRTGDYARTFPAWFPFFPMDRIYFRGLHLVQCELLKWNGLSDHLALSAEFSIKGFT